MTKQLGYLSETERAVVESFVEELRKNLGAELVSIRLFGSKARGGFSEDSDIDIFILVKEKTPDVRGKVAEATANYDVEYGLPLTAVVYDLFEYDKNKELGSFFFDNVEREGIVL